MLTFLTLLTAALQALVHSMNATKDISRIRRLRTIALASGKRRCRVPLRDDGDLFIDCVVENDDVFIVSSARGVSLTNTSPTQLERDSSMELLTDEFVLRPSIARVWPVALALNILSPVLRLFNKSSDALQEATEPVLGEGEEDEEKGDEKGDEKSDDTAEPTQKPQRPLKASEKMRNTRRRKANK